VEQPAIQLPYQTRGAQRGWGSGTQNRDDIAKLGGVVTGIVFARMMFATVPEIRMKGLTGGAEGDVTVAPQSIQPDWIAAAGVGHRRAGVD
jgi:hypothetical protein